MPRLKDFTLIEQVVLALSIVLLGILVVDPFMLERSKVLIPEARKFLRTITDLGRSNWMLIPTGAAIAVALVLRKRHVGFRNSAAYGLIASTIGFVFVSIGGAGLIANLTKNIIGRARPSCSTPSARSISNPSPSMRIGPRFRPATPPTCSPSPR